MSLSRTDSAVREMLVSFPSFLPSFLLVISAELDIESFRLSFFAFSLYLLMAFRKHTQTHNTNRIL